MDWRDVAVWYRYELRAAVRERSVVINTFLIPIFMYPFLLWAAFTGITYVAGQTESQLVRLVVDDQTGNHSAFGEQIAGDEKTQLVTDVRDKSEALGRIRSGELDALIEILPQSPQDAFSARLYFDKSKDRSAEALSRTERALKAYRSRWLEKQAVQLQVEGREWQGFILEGKNLASDRQMGTSVLSRMLPVFLVIMIAVGCFYPAVDSTAGERERRTWETMMSCAASRRSIMTAKFLYVATLGSVAGLINLTAMLLSAKAVLAPLMAHFGDAFEFRFPWSAFPVLALGTVLLALFVAAVLMILASFARTFREGQSMITPAYMAIILPVVFVRPDDAFTPLQALIPIVNVTKLFGQAINGQVEVLTAALTLGSELACIYLVLRLAGAVTQFEDFMVGSYNGSLLRFAKERFLVRKA